MKFLTMSRDSVTVTIKSDLGLGIRHGGKYITCETDSEMRKLWRKFFDAYTTIRFYCPPVDDQEYAAALDWTRYAVSDLTDLEDRLSQAIFVYKHCILAVREGRRAEHRKQFVRNLQVPMDLKPIIGTMIGSDDHNAQYHLWNYGHRLIRSVVGDQFYQEFKKKMASRLKSMFTLPRGYMISLSTWAENVADLYTNFAIRVFRKVLFDCLSVEYCIDGEFVGGTI